MTWGNHDRHGLSVALTGSAVSFSGLSAAANDSAAPKGELRIEAGEFLQEQSLVGWGDQDSLAGSLVLDVQAIE